MAQASRESGLRILKLGELFELDQHGRGLIVDGGALGAGVQQSLDLLPSLLLSACEHLHLGDVLLVSHLGLAFLFGLFELLGTLEQLMDGALRGGPGAFWRQEFAQALAEG